MGSNCCASEHANKQAEMGSDCFRAPAAKGSSRCSAPFCCCVPQETIAIDEKNPSTLPNRQRNLCIENNNNIHDLYDVMEIIGQGATSVVSRCVHKMTGDTYAVKAVVKPGVEKQQTFKREIEIMEMMDHPNIIKLFEVIQERTHWYLIIELCEGSDLFERIVRVEMFHEKEASIIMRQLCRGISYMHQSRVCHRDLQIDHLMCSTNEDVEHTTVKITGFSLAWQFTPGIPFKGRRGFEIGSLYYSAPEMHSGKYTETVDMWSAGVILYVLLAGYFPFEQRTDRGTLNDILDANYTFDPEYWDHVSAEAKSIVRSLLVLVPQSRRPTAEDILKNEWVITNNCDRPTHMLSKNFMKRFQKLHARNSLKNAAVGLMAYHMDKTKIGDLRETFLELDSNNNGHLTLRDIERGLGLQATNSERMREIFSKVDEDLKSETLINYTDFIAASLDSQMIGREELCWKAFCAFDMDGNGKITFDELRKIINPDDLMEENLGPSTVSSLLSEVDTNGDGDIDFNEFMTLMRSPTSAWLPSLVEE